MKRSVFTILVSVALVLASISDAWCIKAAAKIVKYRQPDGSFVALKVVGDEFFGYTTTLQGHIVSVGPDGYLHYADYNSGALRISGRRVSAATRSISGIPDIVTSVPHHVANSLRSLAIQEINPSRLGGGTATKSSVPAYGSSLVLLVQFPDLYFAIEDPVEYFNAMLNGKDYSYNGATGSVADYFNANFRGMREFSFHLSPIITLSKEAAYYGEHTPYMNDANVTGLVVEACKIASENGVDFSKYDADSDGVVDNVAIIFAGLNEAESGNSLAIWPHKGDIADRNIFCNGVKIASYTCTSEYSGDAEENFPATIGSFCHEYAHWLGLMDMYDVNGDEEGLSAGLYGSLSLMDQGNYLNNGKTPPYLNAVELEMLGVVPIKELSPDRDYRLLPVHMADTLYMVNSSNPGEYFLFECRNTAGWDKYIGGEGLVVYHIDKSENMCGGLSANARWRLNIVNSYASHECAGVLSEHVFYPGAENITSLTSTGVPSFTDWQHSGLGISINGIGYDGGAVLFSVEEDLVYSETVPSVQNFKMETYQRCASISWDISQPDVPDEAHTRAGAFWALTLENESGIIYKGSLPVSSTRFLFKGLELETTCRGKIYMVDQNRMGNVHTFEFTTDAITSEYPFVKLSDNYSVGDVMHVFVQNLVEEYVRIEARVNGEKLSGDSYEFAEAGVYELEVSIKYPDNSVDVITKKIEVK